MFGCFKNWYNQRKRRREITEFFDKYIDCLYLRFWGFQLGAKVNIKKNSDKILIDLGRGTINMCNIVDIFPEDILNKNNELIGISNHITEIIVNEESKQMIDAKEKIKSRKTKIKICLS